MPIYNTNKPAMKGEIINIKFLDSGEHKTFKNHPLDEIQECKWRELVYVLFYADDNSKEEDNFVGEFICHHSINGEEHLKIRSTNDPEQTYSIKKSLVYKFYKEYEEEQKSSWWDGFMTGFFIFTLLWCLLWAFVVNKVEEDCKQKIKRYEISN